VIGIGEKKTPNPFIVACDKFIYIEIIGKEVAKKESPEKTVISDKSRREVISLISSAIDDLADDNGYAFLGEIGTFIMKKQPDFDPRNYGFQKLTALVKNLKVFEIDERRSGKTNIKHVFIRNRNGNAV
jgi:Fe-S-cluster formation regulator IscX/YfhJ